MLRERVCSIQGARWGRRRPEPLSPVDPTPGGREAAAARCSGADASVPGAAAGGRDRKRTPGSGAGDSRSFSSSAPSIRDAAGAVAPAGDVSIAGRLDRRPAVGRPRQRRPARGAASAAGSACLAHAVVLSQRRDGRQSFAQSLLDRSGRDGFTDVSLEPMTEDESISLIGGLLPVDSALTNDDKARMTRDAGGSPFVLEQLAQYAAVERTESHHAPTFARMFETRLGALSLEARRFLETLAICGRPMAPELICAASGVARDRQSLVAMLRASHFIRSSGSSERVETYHDRIREVLAAQVAPEAARRIHGLLVQALLEKRSDDCEALFEHYRGAGDHDHASIQAGLAAEKAAAALAFDRAAFFFKQALALAPASPAAAAWKEGVADGLANAGRPPTPPSLSSRGRRCSSRQASGAATPRGRAVPHWRTYRLGAGPAAQRAHGLGMRSAQSPRAAVLSLLLPASRIAALSTTSAGRALQPQADSGWPRRTSETPPT